MSFRGKVIIGMLVLGIIFWQVVIHVLRNG